MIKAAVGAYNRFHREKNMRLRMQVIPALRAGTDAAFEVSPIPDETGLE
jgi:hypothetical protein